MRRAWTLSASTRRRSWWAARDVFFAATGASSGDLLRGVRIFANGAETHSLAMRARSGTIRWVASLHDFTRLDKVRYEE